MVSRPPPIKALKLFIEVMRSGTLTEAAERIHTTQSAASRILSRLEKELSVELFQRERQRLVPTAAAELLLPEAERVLSVMEDFPRVSQEVFKSAHRHIRILTYARFAQEIFPEAISKVEEDAIRQMSATIHVQSRSRLERWIVGNQFDFALATLPIQHQSVATETIAAFPIVAIMRADHPLASRHRLRAKDFVDVPLAVLTRGTLIREEIDRFFEEADVGPLIRYDVQSAAASYQIAAKGGTVGFCDGIIPPTLIEQGAVLRRLETGRTIRVGFAEAHRRQPEGVVSYKDAIREVVELRLALVQRWLDDLRA